MNEGKGYKGIVITIGGNIRMIIRNCAGMFNNLCRYREKANAAGKDTNNESINAPIVIIMLFKSPGKNLGLFASLEKFFNVGRVKIFGGYTHRSRGFLNEFIIMRNIGKKQNKLIVSRR